MFHNKKEIDCIVFTAKQKLTSTWDGGDRLRIRCNRSSLFKGLLISRLKRVSQLNGRSGASRPGIITMLQINVQYVLNVHEVHKSLTPMGHFGRDINTGVKINRITP
jgi:hypothetical protein